MNNIGNMSKEEITATIQQLKDQLAEVEEEKSFVLSQTGRHVPGHIAREYEATIDRLQKELSHWQMLLKGKEEKAK
ncbi:hypothetical protein [Moorella sp. Hama-1]|uniref:hypothetical protein n=1 Tax=Moorella sp. Hama-1 TaxID=2138101 RepID=UPI000D65905C|nr:hypothetical protein [Moorella sp. Hama-1]BCV21254.1 hypothetical protein hamaS1_13230 [Moorella sp. Hama-1]